MNALFVEERQIYRAAEGLHLILIYIVTTGILEQDQPFRFLLTYNICN